MNSRYNLKWFLTLIVSFAGLLAPFTQVTAADPKKPNIVYIIVDELGYYEPAFMGGANIQTPSLDQMAAEGLRMNNLFAGAPVCAPTRCTLLTGKHSGHTSVRSNGGGTPLRADEVTIASMLKEQGYATGGFGKWGCGGRDSTGVPEKNGFDTFFGYYDQVHAHTYYPPYLIRNSEEIALEGNHGGSTGKTYSQYVIHEAAKSFIREHSEEPFFAYLPYTPPHGLFDIPDTDPAWAIYKDKPWPEAARRYAAMATMVDRQIGEIFQLLKEVDIDDNTLVFFSGDNGGADYFASAEFPRGVHQANKNPKSGVEYRGRKGTLYEGGIRIPFVARWPGKIVPGRVSDYLGYFPDIMPTIAEATHANLPDDVDGISILPELIGETAVGRKQAEHDYLYWEYHGWTAVRQGQWRAVKPAKTTNWALYDLATDPSESKDLAAAHPEIIKRLTAIATQAHETAVEGTFTQVDRQQRDRRAKLGKHDEPQPSSPKTTAAVENPTKKLTETSRPNFLIIIADDLCWRDLGYEGNSDVKTPNLDQLCRESMHLRRMFDPATSCSPTRHALYTGIFPIRSGAFPNHTRVYDGTKSLFTHLKEAGYRVSLQNKGHVGPSASFAYEHIPGADDFTETSKFIRRDATQPWFMVYASNDPHEPWDRGPSYDPEKLTVPPYLHDSAATRDSLARYYGEISKLDEQVGTLMRLLDETQPTSNTLVLFVSEQGSSMPYGGKWSVYDNGILCSTLVRWPNRVQPGSTSNALMEYVDIAPTFLEAAGIDPDTIDVNCPDANGNKGFDGRSVLPVLLGKSQHHRDYVFAQHTTAGTVGAIGPYPMRAVRNARFKFIRNLAPDMTYTIDALHKSQLTQSWQEDAKHDPKLAARVNWLFHRPGEELYDLDADPYETRNIAADPQFATMKSELQMQLDQWLAQQGDQSMQTEMLAHSRQGRSEIDKAKSKQEAAQK